MKTVISARDIEDLLRNGGEIKSLPSDALITPSARDMLRDLELRGSAKSNGEVAKAKPAASKEAAPPAKPLNSKSPKAELDAFFNSPYAQQLKEQICDIG